MACLSRIGFSSLFLLLPLAGGCIGYPFRAELEHRESVPFDGISKVAVDTRNGAIEVQCGSNHKAIGITTVKGASGLNERDALNHAEQIVLEIARDPADPTTLRAAARMPVLESGRNQSARFRIDMPPDAELVLETRNGGVSVTGCARNVTISTSNGRITVADCGGNVRARTSNGPITAHDINGDIDIQSTNGGIELERAGRNYVKARTSNGRIRIVDAAGEANIRSSNGGVEFRCKSVPPAPRIHVVTSNGNVEVEVPRTINADLDMNTSNGRVRADFKDVRVSDFDSSRNRLRARLNDGGGRISVTSSNGSVTLRTVSDGSANEPAAKS